MQKKQEELYTGRINKILWSGRITVFAAVWSLFSCSPVKFVPEDQYLLNKVEVEIDQPDIRKDKAKSYIRQKGNYKILGFAKFYLWLYNLSSKDKEESWLKRIGEPPVVFDPALVQSSEERLKQFLGNKGYFEATVETSVALNEKKRKANVVYQIEPGEQYTISQVNYHVGDSVLRSMFYENSTKTFIPQGTPFDFNYLEEYREKIVEFFRNDGYFYFTRDDVHFLADSSKQEQNVVIDMFIGEEEQKGERSAHTPQFVNNLYISVLTGNTPLSPVTPDDGYFEDTLSVENFTIYRSSRIHYRPELFENLLEIKKDSLYRLDDAKNTFEAFNRLRQFRFIDIQFNKPAALADTNLLDCHIRLAPLSKQVVSFDVEGTNTSGNLGIAGNINYKHRNLFHGAEVLQLNFKGAMERQQRVIEDVPEYFNTREFGSEASLTFPKLLGPGQALKSFREYLPKTVITLGYNHQRRPEYTRTISNVKFGYNWMSSKNLNNNWNLVDFNMVALFQFDPEFIDFIKDLYIKSSFTDHLILAMNYSAIFNTQKRDRQEDYMYFRFNTESAGNLLWLFSALADRPKYHSPDTLGVGFVEYYQLLNTRFAQYLKADWDFRYGYIIDKYNSLVGRAFLGIGLPYGNFKVLPFEKRYFTGGANGIRAWQVRSLGPGTYRAPEGTYPNQSSDIKLEANLEYRFRLINFLEGALFLDAGNIWAINKKDNRPGALFRFDRFYKQLALGTGTGFRFDFDYFLFRLDVGMKLRDPSTDFGNGWIIGHRPYSADDFNLSFAIGYPF